MSYNTFKLFNKCYLNQLVERTSSREAVINVENFKYELDTAGKEIMPEFCNCNFLNYSSSKDVTIRLGFIRIETICAKFIDLTCSSYNQTQNELDCGDNSPYKCEAKYVVPTTTEESTAATKTSTKPFNSSNRSFTLQFQTLFAIFIILAFLNFS